jgi:structural maintenance of chromosome 2
MQEGMFNNANVLYRVRFVDGTSTVTRYAHEASAEENAAPQAQAQEGKRRAAAAQKAQPAGRALAPANR